MDNNPGDLAETQFWVFLCDAMHPFIVSTYYNYHQHWLDIYMKVVDFPFKIEMGSIEMCYWIQRKTWILVGRSQFITYVCSWIVFIVLINNSVDTHHRSVEYLMIHSNAK